MAVLALVVLSLVFPAAVACQELAPTPVQQAAAEDELTLEQAVSLALKNNRLVRNADLEVQKAEHELAATRTHRLPSFQLDVMEGFLFRRMNFAFPRGAWGVFPATGPIPANDIPVTSPRRPFTVVTGRATQPLTQLHRIGLGVRLRELAVEVAREQHRAAQQSVVNEAKKLYFGILQTQSALEAAETAIRTFRELDRVVSESVLQQVALKSEGLEVKARLAKADYEAVALRHGLATQKEHLNHLLGRDTRLEFRVHPVPEPSLSPADLTQARARALAERPEIQEAKLKLRQAEQDRSMKKSEFIPDVSLAFLYLSPFNIEVLPKNVTAAALTLSWDVFDWGRKKQELAIKSKTIEQAKNAVETAEAQILVEVDSQYRKMEESRRLLRVVQMAQEAAREKVRIATNRHAQQAALLKDVLQAEASLAETNYQYQQALSSFLTAQADFEKATGSTTVSR